MSENQDPKIKNTGTPINRFLTKLGVRGRTSTVNKEKDVTFKVPNVPNKSKRDKIKSPSKERSGSPFNRLVNRLSGRRNKRSESEMCDSNSCDSHERNFSVERSGSNVISQMLHQTPPRPARSENDLRHVTLTRGSNLCVTPLAGVSTFMSEDNLAMADCGTPAHKVPSYMRISNTLYGYNRSPRCELESNLQSLGQSLVERRLNAFTKMQTPRNNMYSTPTRSPASRSDTCSSPYSSVMGAHISAHTPSPIKALIGQFDQFHLCSNKEEKEKDIDNGKENVKPQLVINQPKVCDIVDKSPGHVDRDIIPLSSLEQPLSLVETTTCDASVMAHATHETNVAIQEATKVSGGVAPVTVKNEVTNMAHVIQVKPFYHNVQQSKTEEEKETKNDISVSITGKFYFELMNSKRNDLQKRSDQALRELEQIKDLPEGAGDAIRMAAGKAALLIRKKMGKFEELLNKNLNPIKDDPQPVTVTDLGGYWAMVVIELEDIEKCFEEVDGWRERGWKENEKKEEESPKVNTIPKSVPRKPPVSTQANAEKLKAEAARRKQMIAHARAKAKLQQEQTTMSTSPITEGLMVL